MPKHSIESDSSTSSKRLKYDDSELSNHELITKTKTTITKTTITKTTITNTTTRTTTMIDSLSRGKVQDSTPSLHNKMSVPVLPSQTSNVITIPVNLNHEDYLNRLNYLFYNKKNLQKHLNLIDQIIRNDIRINN